MEAIIVETLMGVIGGAILGLIAVPSLFRLGKSKQTTKAEAQVVQPVLEAKIPSRSRQPSAGHPRRSSAKSSRILRPRPNRALATMGHTASQPVKAKMVPTVDLEEFQVCPSCGLQAPEYLMGEHFLGSPTHRNGKPPAWADEDETQWEGIGKSAKDPDPSTLNLMRSLMHLLVPPRAFGLRGQERKVDPLDGLVKRSSILENVSVRIAPVA